MKDAHHLLRGKIPGKETGIEIRKSVCTICDPMTQCGLDLSVKDGEVKAVFTTETKEVRGLIAGSMDSLRNSLEENGVSLGEFQVTVSGEEERKEEHGEGRKPVERREKKTGAVQDETDWYSERMNFTGQKGILDCFV